MKLPDPPAETPSSKVPFSAMLMMILVVIGLGAVAIYSNVRNWKRDKIETVIVTPVATPAPGASP
jgi:hypothetical protein